MKTRVVFEVGDHVECISGQYKGRVGVVTEDESEMGYGEIGVDEIDEWNPLMAIDFKYITKTEYNKKKPNQPILNVESLEHEIKFQNNGFKVGCQTISKADAKKIAAFLLKFAK